MPRGKVNWRRVNDYRDFFPPPIPLYSANVNNVRHTCLPDLACDCVTFFVVDVNKCNLEKNDPFYLSH